MTEPDEVKELFNRFESAIDVREARDSEDVIRKFAYWQNRTPSIKQKILLRKYAKQKGLGITREKPRGISARKGKPREELRRHYTTHKVRGRTRMVARIPKGKKGAGRFATKS